MNTPYSSIVSNNITIRCAVSISLYPRLSLFGERKRQVVIEQIWFRSTVFLSSEFREENSYSGVNFCGKIFAVIFICGNLFLRIAGKSQKSQKLEPAKISCFTVFETLWKHHLLQSYENMLKISKSCSVRSQKINSQGKPRLDCYPLLGNLGREREKKINKPLLFR